MFKIPENEQIWVQFVHKDEITHIITSTKLRDFYYLYQVKNNKLIKTKHKSENPIDLEKYIKERNDKSE